MTSLPSPSTENQCSDVVTDAANSTKNKDMSSGHVDDDEEEDEEGDMDFNPFLKEAPFLEPSSSLSSEIEEFDADVDSGENRSPVINTTNAPDELQDDAIPNAPDNTTLCDKENEPNINTNIGTDVTVDSDDEDAIWRRTRARYSLVGFTLDELETFLQETDDEDDLHHNIDDEEEYRKFLAAVLHQENENVDEDEDNDFDFELEIQEALESDADENLQYGSHEREHETRQKKRRKTDTRLKKFPEETKRPLRPLLPYSQMVPLNYNIPSTSAYMSSFTPEQIGQLHCLMYEHVQLLVQVFSLSILEPSRQHIATQVHKLLLEMLHMRDQVVASQRIPYPGYCFNLPYFRSAATGHIQPMERFFWVPFVSDVVLSVMDVAPLNLVRGYMDDVSIAVQEHHQRQLEVTYDPTVDKECLFPFKSFEPTGVSSDPTLVADKAVDQKSKKTIAAALVERSKKQTIALVPKEIAKLALRFFPLFNPALFPHRPPPVSVANRVLFTDSEDGLLARGLMKYNTDWKEIQKNYLPCKTPHQIFVRQKNRACSRAPENPIKAVRRIKTSPLTPQERVLIEEGLKIYKHDWTAVWKHMVPHRDPTLLARQWRTAVGNQKSYKGDEHTKLKRRIYESKRRKSKLEGSRFHVTGDGQNREGWSTEEDANPLPGFPRCRTLSDKENCSTDNAGGENNSGDDGGNNEDEAYVHEAFLADWRPGPASELAVPNLGENQNQPVELYTQHRLPNDTRLVRFHPHHSQHPNRSSHPHPFPAKILRSSEPEINIRNYRARISDCSRLVKLAPDLPPVNLPPTVRIMSQSAFTKYQDETSSKTRERVVSSSPLNHPTPAEKGNSDLQMHPLLFQHPEDESLPYYPLNNGASCSSSSFDFFPNNLNLFRYSHQEKHTLNFFNNSLKSKELSSSLTGVDFHPLLQRTDDGNGTPLIPELPLDSSKSHQKSSLHDHTRSTAINGVPLSPNELDLDIRLSSTTRKENGENGNDPDSGACSVGIRNDEIVMEQEELSDSEDEEMAESVEFECEEMTDSEGEGGSDSDHVENMQNEDLQDDPLAKVMLHGDDSDQDESRFQVTSKSNTNNEKDEPRSSLGLSLNPKSPVTRNSRSSNSNRSSKNATRANKKPRKRAQKQDPR